MRRTTSAMLLVLLLGWLAASEQPALAHNPAMDARDAQILAAARAASDRYQRHVDLTIGRLADPETRVQAMRVLANLHDPEVVPHIIPYLDWDIYDTATVAMACHALVELRAVEATPQLRRMSDEEFDPGTHREDVRLAALNALHQLDQLGSVGFMREAETSNPDTRAVGVTDLGTIEAAEAGKILKEALLDDRSHIRRMAAIGLGKLGSDEYGHDLIVALADSNALVRRYAAEALVRLDHKPAIPYILIALDANRAAGNLVWALRQLAGDDFGFDPYANRIDREAAVERGFIWWTANKKDLDPAP